MTQYAARYRAARAYAGLSQDDLAERLGVDAQTVKRRESGAKEPKKAELIAVAAICQVPLEFMESGWGRMTADELGGLVVQQNELLAEQSELLRELKAAVAEQREVRTDIAETIRRLGHEIVQGPQEEEPSPQPVPERRGAVGNRRATSQRTP